MLAPNIECIIKVILKFVNSSQFTHRQLFALTISFLSYFTVSNAQQCTLPSQIFLPTADNAIIEEFGESLDIDGNYMVAGIHGNSSDEVYSGKVIVYKLGHDNAWIKIAELTPSSPAKYLNFGNKVAISGNSIIVSGREFNDEGTGRDKLYIFEKDPGDDWVSATESYVLTYPFSALSLSARFGEFDVIDNELVVLTYGNQSAKIEVYTKSAGVYSLTQTINTPNGFNGQRYTWKIAFSPGVILIASDQFEHQDRQIGGAFIYEKHLESYPTSPKVLKAVKEGTQNWSGFGAAIAMSNNTVFIKGFKENGNLYSQSFYVFEKPLEGWTDATLPIMFEAPGYFDSNGKLVANDNYLFSTGFNFLNIVGFKKPVGGWSSEAMSFVLNDESLAEKSSIGWQLKLEGSHLIVGCPSRVSVKGLGRELIVDYFSATQAWETTEVTQKLINHVSDINATDDFFGEVFSVYGDRLAISAIGDDKHGLNSGVVYLFDAKGERIEPDFKIHNPEESNSTGFGRSLAMGDSIIFIGAPFKDSLNADGTTAFFNIGAVYVYRLTTNGWEYSTQILAPKMRPQINFGRQVAWTPGYCAVTEFYSGSSESIGRVHIYKENVTTKQFLYLATLDPSVHLRSDFFGKSMVMNDSLMVIGTGNFAPNVSYRLSAYVFKKKEEWKNATEDARLYATDSGWSDRFGASVSLYDQYIVVGAPYSPGLDPRPIPRDYLITGAAYIFKQPAGGWKGQLTEIAKLTPEDPTEFGTFGTTVIIDHNDIFIGSPNRFDTYNLSSNLTNNDNSLIPGKVYHYKKPIGGEWETTNQALRQIQSFDPDIIDAYGASMFITDRYLYVGSMLDNTSAGYRTGSVQTMMQLPVIDSPSKVVCLDQSPFKLFGFPKNGNWTGSGIDPVTGIFNPAIAGVGIHTINYERSGCETSVQIEVLNNDLLISQRSSAVQVKCIGTSVPLVFESNADKYDYTWYFKESSDKKFVKTDSLKQSITAIKPGFYQVIVDRGVCPDHVEQFTIVDEEQAKISIEPLPTLCEDIDWKLTATPPSGFWSGPSISANGIINTASLQDGSYKALYKFVTPLGCIWKDSVLVNVDKLKHPTIEYNGDLICGDNPVELLLTNVDTRSLVTWYGITGNNGNQLKITIDKPGNYRAEVSKLTCTLSTPSIEIGAVSDSLFVPNVITANEDNLNDYFEVKSRGIEDFNLILVNRYGNVVFETNNIAFRWSGANVSSGVYFWSVQYTTCWRERKFNKGWLHVIK